MRGRWSTVARLALALVLALALQTVIASRLPVLGVTADVFLILVVLVGVVRGSMTGAVFGFCAGLVADILFLEPIGLRTVIYLVAGYLAGRYPEAAGAPGAWVVMLLTALVSLLSQTVYGIFQFVTGPQAAFFTMLRVQILPAALLDGLLAVPVYLGFTRLRLLPRPEASDPSFR
jgi:rod shape-determining protein MreD